VHFPIARACTISRACLAGSVQTYTTFGLFSGSSLPEGRLFTGLANHRTGHLDPFLKRPGTHAVEPSTYVEPLRLWKLDMPEVARFLSDSVCSLSLIAKAAGWTHQSRCHITENPQSFACLGLCNVLIKTTLRPTSSLFLCFRSPVLPDQRNRHLGPVL
jgi:hypothetical protein